MVTDDFFRVRLDGMVDLRHPLSVLASRMPWLQIEAALAPAFVPIQPPGVRNQAPLLRLRCISDTLRKILLAGPCF